MEELTERQLREIEYHKQRAVRVRQVGTPVSYKVLDRPERRWWNHHWADYAVLCGLQVPGKCILIPGCGDGADAILLNKLGAQVHAFDLSPDMLDVARERADREEASVEFRQMAAEQLSYADNTFDVIFARDILHHCDLARCLPEFLRVLKPGGVFLIDELYTHRALQRLRESRFGLWLRSKLWNTIYPEGDEYISEDERKLTECDLAAVKSVLTDVTCRYFGMFVWRFMGHQDTAAKIDRIVLKMLGPAGSLFAGRFILTGTARK